MTAALLGGGAIYLAYALFTRLPDLSHLQDNFKFRQYLRLHFIKLAAGSLLLIFGGYVVLATVLKTVRLERLDSATGNKTEVYSGATADQKRLAKRLALIDTASIADNFHILGTLPQLLARDTDGAMRFAARLASSRSRLYIMLALWEEGRWGDPIVFRDWILAGEPTRLPNGVKPAAVQYYYGQQKSY